MVFIASVDSVPFCHPRGEEAADAAPSPTHNKDLRADDFPFLFFFLERITEAMKIVSEVFAAPAHPDRRVAGVSSLPQGCQL